MLQGDWWGSRRHARWPVALAVALMLAGCGKASSEEPANGLSDSSKIDCGSPAVGADGVISPRVSCGAGTLWLPLKWGSVPDGTDEIAVYIGRFKYKTVDGARKLIAPFGSLVSGIEPGLHGIAANTFPPGAVPANFGSTSCPLVRKGQNILLGLFAFDTGWAGPGSLEAGFTARLTEEVLGVEQPKASSKSATRLTEKALGVGRVTAT